MTPRPDLIEQCADLVVAADPPQRLAERTLEVVMALVGGRSGGVFAVSGGRLWLFASLGIDQHVLDAVDTLWRRAEERLRRGEPVSIPDRAADRDLGRARGGPASVAVFPVRDGEELAALLYLDGAERGFCDEEDLERLGRFARLLLRAVRPGDGRVPRGPAGWEAYLERTPVERFEREKLLLLLQRNRWNIARVARIMGITRRTVYMRLRRYNIPRERARGSRLGPAAAS